MHPEVPHATRCPAPLLVPGDLGEWPLALGALGGVVERAQALSQALGLPAVGLAPAQVAEK